MSGGQLRVKTAVDRPYALRKTRISEESGSRDGRFNEKSWRWPRERGLG